jgi:hypothetical protein
MFASIPSRQFQRRPRRIPFRPRLEGLEDRPLLATFTVSRLADAPNPGSLRWAITPANTQPGDDIIDFAVTGAINLAGALPDVSTNIDIHGPGASRLTVRQDLGAARTQLNDGVFDLNPDPSNEEGDALDSMVIVQRWR